mmetsp:Transcript_17895/g.29037  ORF Transcript_17895/g.29037 Transcript_17895/m.29037 type:complete len:86 (-) Transcript_17895:110-367(-)
MVGKAYPLHLVKLWKKYQPVHGLITRTVSPYRQDVIRPLFKHMPENAKHRVMDNLFDVVPPFALGIALVWWADSTFHKEGLKHRD